jgi:hypothetical protein
MTPYWRNGLEPTRHVLLVIPEVLLTLPWMLHTQYPCYARVNYAQNKVWNNVVPNLRTLTTSLYSFHNGLHVNLRC